MNVVIDGLYLTLVGLCVVFVVLILLMLSIYFLNFFEGKFFSNNNNLVAKEEIGVKNSITKDIAAAVAVAVPLALVAVAVPVAVAVAVVFYCLLVAFYSPNNACV